MREMKVATNEAFHSSLGPKETSSAWDVGRYRYYNNLVLNSWQFSLFRRVLGQEDGKEDVRSFQCFNTFVCLFVCLFLSDFLALAPARFSLFFCFFFVSVSVSFFKLIPYSL